jgi:ribosome-binding factor A
MHYKRADRVAVLLKEEVSQLLIRNMKDPDLGFITITKVKLSADLRNAKIYYSVLGSQDQKTKSERALGRSLSYIRGEIGHRMKLRYVPAIQFYYDDSAEYAERIEELLKKLNQ